MSAANFAEELMLLISRWTRSPVLNTNDADNLAPLTKQQLLNTIKSVVRVKLGVHLQERSQTEIAASSSSSSAATTIKEEDNIRLSGSSYRSESLDDLLRLCEDSDKVTSVDQLLSRSQEEVKIIKSPADKFISRSTPTIYKSFTDRLDTFVRKQAEKPAVKSVTKQQKDESKKQSLLMKVEVLSICAADVVTKLGELKEDMSAQKADDFIRPLPIPAAPKLGDFSLLRVKLPPLNLRRSTIGAPETSAPKSVKTKETIEKEKAAAAKRKTMYPGSHIIKPLKMPPMSRSPISRSPISRSPISRSPIAASPTTKKSPTSILKSAKSTKYAHVQSTIPKAGPSRKTQ